jgi:bacillithiol biosynthesis deacetylase BshB1
MIRGKKKILAIGAHPDDVELGCGATLARLVTEGHTVFIIDLTRGELGTRGSAEIRQHEAIRAAEILEIKNRYNLAFRDGFFVNDEVHQRILISYIRHLQPDMVIGNAPVDRHPDHGRACSLIRDAVFFSGLNKIETKWEKKVQPVWRPTSLFHYIQGILIKPDIVVDVSEYWEKKMQAIMAYKTQFYSSEDVGEPSTYISSPEFFESITARGREMGINQGFRYAEGFISSRVIGVRDLTQLV